MNKQLKIALFVIFGVLLADQLIKIYVKTHFYLGEEYVVFRWFKIHFTENPGMAFGYEFGGVWGKLLLSLFRIGAAAFGVYYLRQIIRKKMHAGYVASIGFIFAGAVGNIIDSMFYGLCFSDSAMGIAQFMPAGGGYAGFLHGQVVDMLYFPIMQGNFPDWVPVWGGEYFIFFRPVCNLADVSISAGVVSVLLFQKRFFAHETKPQEPADHTEPGNNPSND
ncbi:MAG TPA: lipoprotein signal peptidase [Bacteroidia bacterium]|jgi:signal peptidase II|nr:lipoprotein signal peptidase [Bacteroidia bacterium]